MAKIKIVGDAMVITSSSTLEDIKKYEKYRPEALELKSEDGKEVVFKVGSTTGEGSINKFGASFGSASHDDEKLATITMVIPSDVEDAKKYAEDKIGAAILKLAKVEAQFAAASASIDEEIAEVRAAIEVA